MTDRHLTVLAVSAAMLIGTVAVAGCGGDEDTTSDRAAKSSSPAEPSTRQVTARVAGRTLTGHCRGTQHDTPAVLLDSGMAAGQDQLAELEDQLAQRTVVCAYDRAGVGGSDPPAKTPRPLTDLVADLDSFLAAAKMRAPYVLVGQSAGATIVLMYAQAHPDNVAGFVSMNPVPPSKTYIRAVRKVETKSELQEELLFDRGENDEAISFAASERQLTDPLPSGMSYAVMFDEDCGGDTEFCRRILPPLTRVTKSLAAVGEGGLFVRAKDAGHDIFATNPELVLKTVDDVLNEAN